MRLTTVILLASLLQVSASALAQKISLTKSNAPLKTVLKEIKQQSGYDFIATASLFKAAKPVTINIREVDFEAALKLLFSDQPLTYSINNTTVTIKEKASSVTSVILNSFQNLLKDLTVRGVVKDQDGKPLPNASIRIKGKGTVINTNTEGEFEIKGVADDAVLLISFVGYKTLELPLKDTVMPLEIKLNVATGELEEVKIVYDDGYQKLNKERSTGSFVQIDNELFNRQVGTTVLDRIANVTSGLIANPISTSAIFGNGGKFVIRGFSTINANKDALIVVDNFPFEGDLNNLNPNDIESITVLKDASAAAIWGVRAGNGVVVITTKKGKLNQKIRIGFNSSLSIGEEPDLSYIPYISSKEMVAFESRQFSRGVYNNYDNVFPSINSFPVVPRSIEILLAAKREGISDPLNDNNVKSELSKLASYDVRDDIKGYLLQSARNEQYALNVSGGSGNFTYYASIGYDKGRGNNIQQNNSRTTINFANTYQVLENLEISTRIVYNRSLSNSAGVDYSSFLPGSGKQISPYTLLADQFGNPVSVPSKFRSAYIDTAKYPGLLDWHYRPLEDYHYIDIRNRQNDTRVGAIIRYVIQPWLRAELQAQNQFSGSNGSTHRKQESFFVRNGINQLMTVDGLGKIIYPWPLGDVLEMGNSESKAWNVRGSLSFDKQWNFHHVSTFAGIELRETTNEATKNELYGYDPSTYTSISVNPTQSFPARPNGSIGVGGAFSPVGSLTRNGSYFANGAYNFKSKYFFTISGRIDQSNFFGVKANLRRVPLWSTGLAWNTSQEDFYSIKWLPLLKFRASYGYTGNTNSGASSYAIFRYLNGNEGVPIRNVLFGELLSPNNPELRWERVKVVNIGVDFGLRNNKLTGSIEYYKKNGLDLLGPVSVDLTTGVSTFTGNRANIKGKGVDLILNTRNNIGKSFEWKINFLLSYNKDIVTAYGGTPPTPSSLPTSANPSIGAPLYPIYSFRWGGLSPINGDPRIYLGDTISIASNYLKAKKEDMLFNGQRNPKIFGSFMNTIKWKGLSVSANIIYRLGHYFKRSSIRYNSLLSSGWSEHADYELRWIKPGDELTTNVPSIPSSSNSARESAYLNSSVLVEKADHIRLQDIRLNYVLNMRSFFKLPFRQCSLYIYAANLGIIWKANKKGLDPEASQFGSLPAPKTISFGLNADF